MGKSNKALFQCSNGDHEFESSKFKKGRWNPEEHERFLKGCYEYKNDWKKIENYIKTRSIPQIRSHAQKYLIKICRKYSIKLSQKKFLNKESKHLTQSSLQNKSSSHLDISSMNEYDRNIFEMFNYYNREIADSKDISNCKEESTTVQNSPANNTEENPKKEIENLNISNQMNSNFNVNTSFQNEYSYYGGGFLYPTNFMYYGYPMMANYQMFENWYNAYNRSVY